MEKSTRTPARCGRADSVFAVFSAQIVDAFIEPFERFALVAIEQGLLPAGALQGAGADAEQPHGFTARQVLPQQGAEDIENLFVKAGRRGQRAGARDGLKVTVADLYRQAASL